MRAENRFALFLIPLLPRFSPPSLSERSINLDEGLKPDGKTQAALKPFGMVTLALTTKMRRPPKKPRDQDKSGDQAGSDA
jgi:hypothetical protein